MQLLGTSTESSNWRVGELESLLDHSNSKHLALRMPVVKIALLVCLVLLCSDICSVGSDASCNGPIPDTGCYVPPPLPAVIKDNASVPWESLTEQMLTMTRANVGNTYRFQQFLGKLQRGEEARIAALGGSVTMGIKCDGDPGEESRLKGHRMPWKCAWPQRVTEWLQAAYPHVPPERLLVVNLAKSSTTTQWADTNLMAVAQHDGHPLDGFDLFLVDYQINDQELGGDTTTYIKESTEELLLQLLTLPRRPAVVYFFTGSREWNLVGHTTSMEDPKFTSARPWLEDEQMKVLRYYQIPALSWRDALWPFAFSPSGKSHPLMRCQDHKHPTHCAHYVWAAVFAHFFRGEAQRYCAELEWSASRDRLSLESQELTNQGSQISATDLKGAHDQNNGSGLNGASGQDGAGGQDGASGQDGVSGQSSVANAWTSWSLETHPDVLPARRLTKDRPAPEGLKDQPGKLREPDPPAGAPDPPLGAFNASQKIPLTMLSVDKGQEEFVPSTMQPPGSWQYREDVEGKPGWIVEGPGGGEEISFDVMFTRRLVAAFMSSYENMGQVEVYIEKLKPAKGQQVDSPLEGLKVIRAAVKPATVLDSLWQKPSSQYSQKTLLDLPSPKSKAIPVRVRLKRLEAVNGSGPPRGLNKFKLLSILSY
eukprot:jgi/Mesvir1/15531/Mv03181-RA.1